MYDYNAKAVVKVQTKSLCFHFLEKVFVGCSNHANIYINVFIRSYPCYFPLLQCPQHFCLRIQTHVSDLVQEKCPTISLFELPNTLPNCRSERPFFVTEQFTLN